MVWRKLQKVYFSQMCIQKANFSYFEIIAAAAAVVVVIVVVYKSGIIGDYIIIIITCFS
jgi:hypothetical protein